VTDPSRYGASTKFVPYYKGEDDHRVFQRKTATQFENPAAPAVSRIAPNCEKEEYHQEIAYLKSMLNNISAKES
jgi:hypothetical protein